MKQKIVILLAVLGTILIGCSPTGSAGLPTQAAEKSANADLNTLSVDSGTLTPAFAAETSAYTLSVPNAVTSVTVSGTQADENATVSDPVTLNDLVVGTAQ